MTSTLTRGYIRPELDHLTVPLTDVVRYPGNARRGDHPKITASLQEHGQYKPLLAQRTTGHLLVGNNTAECMEALGWTHAAVVYLDLDDTAARKLLLMDNASSDQADYDPTGLADLLADLPEFDGTGWTPMDLDGLLADINGGTALSDLPQLVMPVSAPPAPLPPRPTADPFTIPRPTPTPFPAPEPRDTLPPSAPPRPGPTPTPVEPRDPIPTPPPIPPADPRTVLPPVLPPTTRQPAPAPDAPVPWHLTLPKADRDEAHRLIAHAREWLHEPALDPAEAVMRGLRLMAAVGDLRHNPTTTINLTTLLLAAGRDPLAHL